MNNIKKTGLGLLIAVLAFGFSAFKINKRVNLYRYYKTNPSSYPTPSDPRGYEYYAADHCETVGDICSAVWDIGSASSPIDGSPLPPGATFQGYVLEGHYE